MAPYGAASSQLRKLFIRALFIICFEISTDVIAPWFEISPLGEVSRRAGGTESTCKNLPTLITATLSS